MEWGSGTTVRVPSKCSHKPAEQSNVEVIKITEDVSGLVSVIRATWVFAPVGVKVVDSSEAKTFDTRSFIMSQPQLQEPQPRNQQHPQARDGVQSALPRTVQARYTHITV